MDGGDERGVFVLSRELHKRLPQHFINNSAYGQKGGVGGMGAVGRQQHWRPGEPRSPASSRDLATEPGGLRGPV